VVKELDLVKMVNAVVSMDGVEKQINIVIWRKVVNPNLENVIQRLIMIMNLVMKMKMKLL